MKNIEIYNQSNQNFFKRNYIKAVEFITPNVYFDEDYDLSGNVLDPLEAIINSHLNIANNFSSIINVSAIQGTSYSSINTLAGIAPYFVKQNNLTQITPYNFESDILSIIDYSFRNFNSSAEFSTFLNDVLLPGMRLNSPAGSLFGDYIGDAEYTPSAIHNYLIGKLNWLYFLNIDSDGGLSYEASTVLHDLLINKTFRGKTIELADAIKGVTEYIY